VFGTALAIFAAVCAPFIKNAPQGLYMFMQEFNALFTVPMLLMIAVGMISKKATTKSVLPGMFTYMVMYLFFKFIYTGWELHFLHKVTIYFLSGLAVTMYLTSKYPAAEAEVNEEEAPVNVENWKYLRIASISTLAIMVATYALASPIGVVAPVEEIPGNVMRILIGSVAGVFVVNHLVKLYSEFRNNKQVAAVAETAEHQ
jgi:SSS family solute:Na+ symporter